MVKESEFKRVLEEIVQENTSMDDIDTEGIEDIEQLMARAERMKEIEALEDEDDSWRL